MLWLASCTVLAGTARAADFYTLNVSHDGDRYQVSADVHLAAPPAEVYQVLTDFNHLTRITGAILKSQLLQQVDAHTALVYTDSRACVAFICRHILQVQRVTELTSQDIVAEALPDRSNVREGTASWHLQAEGDGTRMHWEMTVAPDFWIPPLIGPALVEGSLRRQGRYTAVGVEKLARERANLPPLAPDTKHDTPAPPPAS